MCKHHLPPPPGCEAWKANKLNWITCANTHAYVGAVFITHAHICACVHVAHSQVLATAGDSRTLTSVACKVTHRHKYFCYNYSCRRRVQTRKKTFFWFFLLESSTQHLHHLWHLGTLEPYLQHMWNDRCRQFTRYYHFYVKTKKRSGREIF